MTHPHAQEAGVAGFTLLEMLLMLAAVTLVAVVALPVMTSPSDNARLQASARDFAAALRLARSTAIVRGTDVLLLIEVDKHRLAITGLPPRRYAQDLHLKATIAEPERIGATGAGFRFFSDGSATGGSVRLRLGARETVVCVDWLTGRTALAGAC